MQSHKNVPLFPQFLVFLIQLGIFLAIDWLDVRHNYRLPLSDTMLWSVTFPAAWIVYTIISYYYSQNRLSAAFQGLLQTLVSYGIVSAIMLFFHQFIGGSF